MHLELCNAHWACPSRRSRVKTSHLLSWCQITGSRMLCAETKRLISAQHLQRKGVAGMIWFSWVSERRRANSTWAFWFRARGDEGVVTWEMMTLKNRREDIVGTWAKSSNPKGIYVMLLIFWVPLKEEWHFC